MNLSDLLLTSRPPAGLWLLCGPPASGKSSFRRYWWRGMVISPDELRLQIAGAPFDPRFEPVIWTRVRQQVRRRLRSDDAILLDATNIRRADRRRWLSVARAAGQPAFAVVCWDPAVVPPEELLRRNAGRPHPVPAQQVLKKAAAWQPPMPDEGFAGVWTVLGNG